jgi:hypothetical protein
MCFSRPTSTRERGMSHDGISRSPEAKKVASVYQLGSFGTARKELKALPLTP